MSQRNLITNFNASPFYDDFDEAKKFLRILFRPTYPVQARELTQLQSILSNQVSRFGSSIYKDGSTVTGGSLSLTDVVSIKLPTGTVFTGGTNNLTSLLSQSNAGTGYQVNDVLKLRYGASDSILATIGANNTFTYALVNNITPAGFFGKILTENYNVTTGAQDAQFQVNQKVTCAVTPTYTILHSSATDTSFTVDELATQTTSGATGTVLTSTYDADADVVTTVLIPDTISTIEFDTLSAVVGGTSSRSGTPTSVTTDRREESPIFRVLGFTTATTTDLNPTIFGVYETEEEFISGDEIRLLGEDDSTITTTSLGTLPAGNIQFDSQIASVSEGVFYTNGFFVQIDQQSIPLNKYDRTTTARIGYDIGESTVSETDDPTLLDNATGATNANAPGAHRFKLSLTLNFKPDVATNDDIDNTSDINFYQIGRIEIGSIIERKVRAEGSAIAEHVAKGINDIQGNFVVKPFLFTIEDNEKFTVDPTSHTAGSATVRVTASVLTLTTADFAGKTITSNGVPLKIVSAVQNPDNNAPASSYADIFDLTLENVSSGTIGGTVPPWLTTAAETSLAVNDPDNFQATLAPGLAYVDGYRYETIAPTKIDLEKTITSKHVSEAFTFSSNVSMGNYLPLTRKSGTLLASDFAFGTKVLLYATKQGTLPVHDGAIDQAIGTARIKQLVRNDGSGNTWGADLSGDATGQVQGTLEAYLFDLKFNDGAVATDTTTGNVGGALARVTATLSDTADAGQKRIDFDASSASTNDGAHLLGASFVDAGVRYRVTEVAVTLTHAGASTNYAAGQLITGVTSGAVGEVIVRTDATNTILFNVIGTFLESEEIYNSSGTISQVAITATGVSYSGAAIKTNINLQNSIDNNDDISFDYDARNIKSIRFGLEPGTATDDGAIYDVNTSAELVDSHGYAATQLQEPDKKKLIFPVSEHYVESIKNTTVMYMKTVDVTISNAGVATPSLRTANGTESIVQDITKVIGIATQTVTGAVNYTIGDHLRVGSISSSTITFVQNNNAAISGATLTARISFPVIRTSIPSGAFDGDLSIPTDYIFGNVVDTDLFNGSNFVDSAAGQVRIAGGTFVDGAVTYTAGLTIANQLGGVKNWKRIGLTGVTKVVKIYEEIGALSGNNNSLTDATKFTDITSNFDIDFGQHEEYVDQAKIALKGGSPVPPASQDLIVVVDRAKTTTDSGGANIFYSANSYSTLYSNLIPPVQSSDTLDVRVCVDFRPRAKESYDITGKSVTTDPSTIGEHEIEFTDTATVPFASNLNTMTGRITSYYGRADKVVISNDLQMKIIQSKPSAIIELPEADERSLVLYDLSIPSYTLDKRGIKISAVDNAHYTMSDLSNIDQRVQDLERETQLSKVESAILSTEVNDKSNTNLFKTGMLVDTFRNFDVAFPQHDDFQSAIDVTEGVLRPAVDTYALSLDFEEDDAASTATEYPDGIVLAPLNTSTPKIVAIKNVVASKRENVNPFSVSVFEGSMKIFPEKDFWKEKNISNVTIEDPSSKEAWEAIAMTGKENPSYEYGDWDTQWTGKVEKGKGKAVHNFFAGLFGGKKIRHDTHHGTKSRKVRKISYKTEIKNKALGHKIFDKKVIRFMRVIGNGSYSTIADAWGATKANKWRAGIHITAKNMKPRQNVHAFFDGKRLLNKYNWIRPAIIIKVANNSTNKAVYGTSSGAFKGGARDVPASFVAGSKRSVVTLETAGVTGIDAKCILMLKTKDANNIYWHVVPQGKNVTWSDLYEVTKISDFTKFSIDGTSMTITGMTRAKLAGSFRMRTDPTGAVAGLFQIPTKTFSTGQRTIKITDNTDGNIALSKCFAQKNFESSGMALTIENQIMQTRVPVKVVTETTQSHSVSERRKVKY